VLVGFTGLALFRATTAFPRADLEAMRALALQLHFSLEVGTARLGLVSASPE
jgi:hypothetical protein